jgi:lipopolysaccharide/colanic/teichoic acid biosynthesis glycosyltransferase
MEKHPMPSDRIPSGQRRRLRQESLGAVVAGQSAAWPRYQRGKVVLDFGLGLLLGLAAAPVMVLAALAIKLTSRGPAFYSQVRVGKGGRLFTIYKLRTMRHNCEHLTGACWATARDPRVTALGRWLRRTHLDELPQLWNVVRGDMSLVGPRPERPEFVPRLRAAIPGYDERLLVRPGLTGLAQVQLPADTDLESVRRKLAYDRYYVDHLAAGLDLRILVATALHLLGIRAAALRRVCRLPVGESLESRYRNRGPTAGARPRLQPV